MYGPRQAVHGQAGVFCGHLAEGTRPTMFGDGPQTRDWVDVIDVVRAMSAVARNIAGLGTPRPACPARDFER